MKASGINSGETTLRIHPAYYILGILLVMLIRGDGYFPLPRSWPQEGVMLVVLIHWAALVALIALSAYWLIPDNKFRALSLPYALPIALGLIPVASIFAILVLHSLQSARFAITGYLADDPLIIKISALGLIPFLIYWVKVWITKKHSTLLFFACLLASVLIMKSIPLNLFPITAKRSDLLPILKEAALAIFNGENPYKFYLLDNGTMTANVRFPGLIIAYLPAAATGIDLRYITIIFEVAIFFALIYKIQQTLKTPENVSNYPWHILILIVCFMMFPYWHYRHELYESPFWFLLLLTLLAFDKGHTVGFVLGLTGILVTHHWGLLFAPFLLTAYFRKKGLQIAILCLLSVALACFTLFAVFLKGNFGDFYQHTFGTYTGGIPSIPTSMYLSLWFAKFHLEKFLLPLKAAFQLPVAYLTFRYGHNTSALAGILALSLTLVLTFNTVAWTYQYLLVVFLLILGWIFHEDSLREQPV
ncbi:hypothetical protein UR09_04020 [Candidatus Nitromaritima sp. SCGC AAA799-A02]|nr:hypothetical protein UR09_04020 [Candidatus Nitromaritima sp. SCGC AAA799-A02]KMP11890.1 hypothetical protein UZ36_02960 [Candidatus Nitromaritima sp. SCGC AAA799-C22]